MNEPNPTWATPAAARPLPTPAAHLSAQSVAGPSSATSSATAAASNLQQEAAESDAAAAAAAADPPPSDDDDDDAFFFESDHLALRGNADYAAVLRTIAVLQTQRMQVTRSIDQLAAAERRALDDPAAFVRQLHAGKLNQSLPGAAAIAAVAELPAVDFDKYGVSVPEFGPDETTTTAAAAAAAAENSHHNNGGASTTEAGAVDSSLVVRGRMFDQSKPETFNQLWTCEEQKRLEELLIEYPPEPIEMRRFAKIARALGNRTTKQVASRLQKFFKKLHSAGMPVPGRIPKSNRTYVTKAQRMHKLALRSTTFFPAQQVPFHLAEDEEEDAALVGTPLDANWYRRRHGADVKSESPSGARKTYVVDGGSSAGTDEEAGLDENAKIVRLAMRIKADKEREVRMVAGSSEHVGFKCDLCAEEPIVGTRWHCQTCAAVDSIDFCSDCLLTQLQRPPGQRHPIDHRMVALRVSLVDSSMEEQRQSTTTAERLKYEADDDDHDEDAETAPVVKTERSSGHFNHIVPNGFAK